MVIALGSLVIPPQQIIPVSAVPDMVAGAILLRLDWTRGGTGFWFPLAVAMMVASSVGALALRLIPADPFRLLLSLAILALGFWFLLRRTRAETASLRARLPHKPGASDLGFTALGGFFGGLIGISGPPIIWHFGRRFAKAPFRQILIPVFLAGAVARTATYAASGLVDKTVIVYVGVCLPALVLGIFAGNRIFLRISEKRFSVIVGVLLLLVAARLFL